MMSNEELLEEVQYKYKNTVNKDDKSIQFNELINEYPEKYVFGGIFAIANKLQSIGDIFLEEITTKQWFLLAVIGQFFKETPPAISEIAEIMGTSRQNVKQISLKLEKKGFVEIHRDKKDSRILRVNLTEKCMYYFENRNEKDEEFLKAIFKGFETKELFQLANSLDKFYKSILEFKI